MYPLRGDTQTRDAERESEEEGGVELMTRRSRERPQTLKNRERWLPRAKRRARAKRSISGLGPRKGQGEDRAAET